MPGRKKVNGFSSNNRILDLVQRLTFRFDVISHEMFRYDVPTVSKCLRIPKRRLAVKSRPLPRYVLIVCRFGTCRPCTCRSGACRACTGYCSSCCLCICSSGICRPFACFPDTSLSHPPCLSAFCGRCINICRCCLRRRNFLLRRGFLFRNSRRRSSSHRNPICRHRPNCLRRSLLRPSRRGLRAFRRKCCGRKLS